MTDDKLRTLKDIYGQIRGEVNQTLEYTERRRFYEGCADNFEMRLRAEALKWAKELEYQAAREENRLGMPYPLRTKQWIIHFFNLTEEDLR